MDAERKMPPYPRMTVAIIRSKGHAVSVRENRNGSLRYSVDGSREMDAFQMSRKFET